MFKQLMKILGYEKLDERSDRSSGISTTAEADMDYLYEKIGLRAHIISPSCGFNGSLRTKDNDEAKKIESLLFRYAKSNYVFTNADGLLIGNVLTIPTKDERVQSRRSNFILVAKAETDIAK